MKRFGITLGLAMILTVGMGMPVFAHHGGGHHGSRNVECPSSWSCSNECAGGYLCGVDGHFCDVHRTSGEEWCGACATAEQAACGGGHHGYSHGCH